LVPGISLGGFDTEPLAMAELARLNRMGVRTARVVQENEPSGKSMLVLAAVSRDMQIALRDLQPLLQAQELQPCD